MSTASTLAFIMVLAFAADRVAKAIMFCLDFIPAWYRRFPDPELSKDKAEKRKFRNRHLIAYTVIVGAIACSAVVLFDNVRILDKLTGDETDGIIDIIVTVLVIMGGSDILGRIVAVSGIGDMGGAAASGEPAGRNKPVEIVGRLVLENDGAVLADSGSIARSRDVSTTMK